MNGMLTQIGQLAIFLICAQTLIHFRPRDSYEKYIKLLVSMMLLILLVEPVMDLLGKGNRGDFLERVHVYEQELQDILSSPQLETEQIEVILQNITQQKVEEGAVYVKEQEIKEESQQVNGSGVWEGSLSMLEQSKEAITVQVEVETIQEVRVGDKDGESANNH